ncbi:Tol-Pal system beta propeller repeat protein TolB [Lysobacter sp. CFH 32150]|uniref:Tol-Pal system beta propeller repeat protein TolB n=1 Tax=Lysobacter sp. CFH 32150 TaxID=2927128 RepID=UPI001FA74EE6|nr:Tol-Pal system beta propeller repeat protein TolB [Lysobacter sp. CFH 32150]MCI4567772.1 Tol-Pal system beta propeller repeat protein TolB [Lysobacter sp. CFH 32150]
MIRSPRWLATLFALLLPLSALAQQGLEIDIVGGNAAALPIAVVPFQNSGTASQTDIAAVINADLNRSGQFNGMPADRIRAVVAPKPLPSRASEVEYPTWRTAKQDFLVVGRVVEAGGGYRVEYELFDVAKQQRLLGFAINGNAANLRTVAHQIADAIYEKILGVRGAFDTKIAYVVQRGVGKEARYSLMVADADGYGPRQLFPSRQPILSPAWSPDGRKLAFVSFDSGNSAIYILDIYRDTMVPPPVAKFRGINSAPSFSPDGRSLALTLSKGGNPEIYVMDLASKQLRQITNHFGIDTSAVWSPDGGSLFFVSDRGGRPQVYKAPASGGGATRVTFDGAYNSDPSVSFDGKKIAVAQGSGNTYRIALLDLGLGSRWSTLSPGSLDESPSFAPNASMVLYAAREGRRGVLYAVSADARVRQRLVLADGDVREPAWSPYRQSQR